MNRFIHLKHRCVSHLDVAGLLHQPPGVLCSSVALRQLDPEELEGSFEVRLQEVLFGGLERDTRRQFSV